MQQQYIEIQEYGPADTLKVLNRTLPDALGPDEVLIDVKFSGINFADIYMRLGMYADAPPRPFVPGYECSGVDIATGSEVKRLKEGDKVIVTSPTYMTALQIMRNHGVSFVSINQDDL